MQPQYIGIAAGIFTALSLVPQLAKMIKEKKSQDISVFMLLVLLVGLILWIIYGCMKSDWPIVITNAFSLFINSAIIILNFKYAKKEK